MNTQAQSSFPIAGLLGIAFVILKLTGVIAWSWWWVLAPFWAPTVILLTAAAGIALCWLAVLVFTTAAMFFRKGK